MCFINKINPQINDGYVMWSCAFILIKSSDLPLYYFLFSPYVRLCCIDNGYSKASGLVEDLIKKMLEDLLQA
jgi:hypothetical protein